MRRATIWLMSGTKRQIEEYEARGFDAVERDFCREHLIDRYLAAKVEDGDSTSTCQVCGRTGTPMANLESLTDLVVEALTYWYDDPIECLPWDGREGGYQGEVLDTGDVIADICSKAFEPTAMDKLCEALEAAIDADQWTTYNAGFDTDLLEWAWNSFVDDIKRESRFVFITNEDSYRGAPTRVGNYLRQLTDAYVGGPSTLVHREEALTVYRGRLVEDPTSFEATAQTLGPAPSQWAGTNRMSAPGISMMYASADAQTAIAEIAGHGVAPYAVIASFTSTRPISVLDLTKTPGSQAGGSFFDPAQRDRVRMTLFLKSFVHHVTQPVIPDGRQHVEYTPTQVITEYLRWCSPQHLDGIALPSAQTGEKTYVFFCGPEGIASAASFATEALFEYQPRSVQVFEVERHYQGNPSTLRCPVKS